MSYRTIRFEVREATAWVTLNRPDALNATNATMLEELKDAFERVRSDESVKALVLASTGDRAFCIGSDVAFLDQAFGTRDFSRFRDYLNKINDVFFALEDLPVPTVAMVQGKARAGGFEMILACDFVIIAEEAAIGDVHTPYGHPPGAGATQRLARKVGLQRALELIMTGRWLSGTEARDIGIALRAVPRARLEAATQVFLSTITDKPRECLKHVKRCVVRGWDLPLRDAIGLEIQSYVEYLATCLDPVEIYHANQAKRRATRAPGPGGLEVISTEDSTSDQLRPT